VLSGAINLLYTVSQSLKNIDQLWRKGRQHQTAACAVHSSERLRNSVAVIALFRALHQFSCQNNLGSLMDAGSMTQCHVYEWLHI